MTLPPNSFGSPNYRQVLHCYLRLHQLTVEGRDESPDADTIRDSLDLLWRALSEAERGSVQGLSADLFDISEPSAGGPREMPLQAQKYLVEAYEAKKCSEWDRALLLLRKISRDLDPALLSYLRGSVWLEAGYPEIGAVFFEHAAKLEPDNVGYKVLLLHSLEQSDSLRAREMANQVIGEPEKHSPLLVVKAADVAFNATRELTEPDAAAVIRSLIPILRKALVDIPPDENRSVHLMGLVLLALSHEHLGETGQAINYYSQGLKLEPSHDALLTKRGILSYGRSPQAPSDLEQAVKLGSPLVWPYLVLAHHYLTNNRYEDCRRLCEHALQMKASQTVHSQLFEWLAISEAELGFPPERVRATFEQALRLDPTNDTAKRNLETFEQAVPRPVAWDKRSEKTVSMFTFGHAERRLLIAV